MTIATDYLHHPLTLDFLARQLQEYILLCCVTAIMLNFLYPLGIYRNIFPRNSSIRLKHHHHIVSAFRSYHVLQFHRLNLLRNFVIDFGLVAFISDGYKLFDKNIKSIRYSLTHFDTACLVKKDGRSEEGMFFAVLRWLPYFLD